MTHNVTTSSIDANEFISKVNAMSTEMRLHDYVVLICGPNTRKQETKIRKALEEQVKANYKSLRIIFKENKYIPDDGTFIVVNNDELKYHILVELGIMKPNQAFEDKCSRKVREELWEMNTSKRQQSKMKSSPIDVSQFVNCKLKI